MPGVGAQIQRHLPARSMEVSRGLLEGEDAAIAGAPGAHLLLVGGAPLLGLGRVVQGGAVVTTEITPVSLLGKTPAIESSGLSDHIHYTTQGCGGHINSIISIAYIVTEALAVLDSAGVEDVVIGDDRHVPRLHRVGAVGQRLGALVLNVVNVISANVGFKVGRAWDIRASLLQESGQDSGIDD